MTAPRATGLDYHIARLLILVHAFSEKNERGIDGLTKVAKLDFLVRYPSFLSKILENREREWPNGLEPTMAERESVESRMIRYKYGPWDDKYYPIIGALVGMGLVERVPGRGRLAIMTTAEGARFAGDLADREEWRVVAGRCKLLATEFDIPGSALKDIIYAELPDAVDRPLGSVI